MHQEAMVHPLSRVMVNKEATDSRPSSTANRVVTVSKEVMVNKEATVNPLHHREATVKHRPPANTVDLHRVMPHRDTLLKATLPKAVLASTERPLLRVTGLRRAPIPASSNMGHLPQEVATSS